MDVKQILKDVEAKKISIENAEALLKNYQEIGNFVKFDFHRQKRRGVGETVFCPGKTPEQLLAIYQKADENRINLLGSRATVEQYDFIRKNLPEVQFDPVSRLLKSIYQTIELKGEIAVCTGGTADIPAAEEAAQTAEFIGSKVKRYFDVGISGIHRLFDQLDNIRRANVIIAAAGMEGALPGVIAGLLDKTVIALPTSVGYGSSFGGVAPLLTMLNSCAEGIAVVNIDNGYGAGYLAHRINRQIVDAQTEKNN